MSKFSGKCDVCDRFYNESDERIANTKFYVSQDRLDIKNMYDLIPYFPRIICLSTNNTVVMSSRSFVDREEDEMLELYMNSIKKMRRRAKRKKLEFGTDKDKRDVFWLCFDDYKEIADEMFKRVAESGDKATYDGLHLPIYEMYREDLVNFMVEAGYKEVDAENWVRRGVRTFE